RGGGGTVTDGGGLTCPGVCSDIYAKGTAVTLIATPAGGSIFTGWSGACSGMTTTCNVAMTGAKKVTAMFSTPPIAVIDSDFDNDGLGDLLLRNIATGDNRIWFMSGSVKIAVGVAPGFSPTGGYVIAGVGDVNGDGMTDIVLRNNSTGDNRIWFMNGVTRFAVGVAPRFSPTGGYYIAGVGDMNGDGMADIVLRNNSTGDNRIWFMNGATRIAVGIAPRFSPTGGYYIAGVGDMNGDGMADIVLRNNSTGDNRIWFMNGVTRFAVGVAPRFSPSGGYVIAGLSDLNGDGMADILLRNYSTGDNRVWFMNVNARIATSVLPRFAPGNYRILNK
ncbi:MAG: VCBS repeat-containing protein, partial [Nitrospinota bacterium]|nr:VCBS repeat-containing protein [Nitrospinota bacterium]